MLLSSEFDACTTKQMTKAEGCKCVDGISAKYIEIITVIIIFEQNLQKSHRACKNASFTVLQGCDISRQKLAALKLKNKCKNAVKDCKNAAVSNSF